MTTPPQQVGHKTVDMATHGCLATGPQILHFMIEYIKNTKAYKLKNRHISLGCGPGARFSKNRKIVVTQLRRIYDRKYANFRKLL